MNKTFRTFWKDLVGPANWTRTKSPDLRVGDKVQGSMGYDKIRRIVVKKYDDEKPPYDKMYWVYLDNGSSFHLMAGEALVISRTKDEYE
jgi:hypothetical protein